MMWNLDYKELYELSLNHPEKYWDELAKDVVWSKPYTSVLEDRDTTCPRWFVGGEINMSYNCLDRHVEDGYGNEVAVIYDSPITGTIQRLTYNELLESVELVSGVLSDKCGVVKGDRVLLHFPMTPQCLVAMLACTRIGAISTTVFGGFAIKEFAARIKYFEPKIIISTNVGFEPTEVINYKEHVDSAIALSGFAPDYCIIYNRPNHPMALLHANRDLDWQCEVDKATRKGITPVESSHPQFVIFTSGTTEQPKGIVKPTAASVVNNHYLMRHIFGLNPREPVFIMSDFSWILGQTMLSFGALLNRNPTIIYEGKAVGTPDNAQITRVLNENRAVLVVTIPTTMKTLRTHCSKSDLELTYTDLRSIQLGGEMVDRSLCDWMSQTFKCPVYAGWGQTELSGPANCACLGLKNAVNYLRDPTIGLMMPGFQPKLVDRHTGQEVPNGTVGRLLLKLPLAPCAESTYYKDHDRYVKTYLSKYPGYYDTMDAAVITEDGLLQIVARDDDIIHVGAVRICGGAVEEACCKNDDIIEAVVVALEDPIKGNVPFAFLVPKDAKSCNDKEVINKTVALVLEFVGEVASFNQAVVVPNIPRSIIGKILRKSLADMVNGKEYKIPTTAANPQIYTIIHGILIEAGYKATLPTAI